MLRGGIITTGLAAGLAMRWAGLPGTGLTWTFGTGTGRSAGGVFGLAGLDLVELGDVQPLGIRSSMRLTAIADH